MLPRIDAQADNTIGKSTEAVTANPVYATLLVLAARAHETRPAQSPVCSIASKSLGLHA
jgi:hypothetical protein